MKKITLIICLIFTILGCKKERPFLPDEQDSYKGEGYTIVLGAETSELKASDLTLYILGSDGNVFTRKCSHKKGQFSSIIDLFTGLKDGEYQLLYVEYETSSDRSHNGKYPTECYGLGSKIEVKGGVIRADNSYSPSFKMCGKGSKEHPFQITCYDHLVYLSQIVNSDITNSYIDTTVYFQQKCDIDLGRASWDISADNGWLPIGKDNLVPFRGRYNGKGHKIKNIWSDRDQSNYIGIFGVLHNAVIDSLTVTNAEMCGNIATGIIAGCAITSGGNSDISSISSCHIEKCSVNGSLGVGGIIGIVDYNTKFNLFDCSIDGNSSVSGDYGVGGLVGTAGMHSCVSATNSKNEAPITASYSCVGGILGSADTLSVAGCTNYGAITGATKYSEGDTKNSGRGAAGIVGGAGISSILSSINYANISGYEGVGGIVGSSRISGNDSDGYIYNSVAAQYCGNYGHITATRLAGGICGEAQFGGYALYSKGNVTVKGDYAGGIVANAPVAVVHNSLNLGKISGVSRLGGIVGKSSLASLALNQNLSDISGTGTYIGGIMGLSGSDVTIHYCHNVGKVNSSKEGASVGGIIGTVGDPHKLSGIDIALIALGAIEIVDPLIGQGFAVWKHSAKGILKTVLKVTEPVLEYAILSLDAGLVINDIVKLCGHHTAEIMEVAIEAQSRTCGNEVMAEIEKSRNNYSSMFDYRDDIKAFSDYYNSEDESHGELINDNINHKREKLSEEIEEFEHVHEIVHTAIAGVCIVGGAIATSIATFGGATAAMIAAGGMSVVCGASGVIFNSTKYSPNSIIISQCVNDADFGITKDVVDYEKVGGIVGELHDWGTINDCINLGKTTHKKRGGQFIGTQHAHNSTTCSLAFGDPTYFRGAFDTNTLDGISASYSKCYYAAPTTDSGIYPIGITHLLENEVNDISKYGNLDIGGENSKWKMGYSHPLPHKSEMTFPL